MNIEKQNSGNTPLGDRGKSIKVLHRQPLPTLFVVLMCWVWH